MNIKQALSDMGASKLQLESTTLKMVEEAMAKESGIIDDTAIEEVKNLTAEVKKAERQVSNLISNVLHTQIDMNLYTASIKADIEKYETLKNQNPEQIENKDRLESLILFKAILEDVKAVFGDESMTEAVIIKAIEAGSFGLWRGIMGGKYEKTENDRWETVTDGNPFHKGLKGVKA